MSRRVYFSFIFLHATLLTSSIYYYEQITNNEFTDLIYLIIIQSLIYLIIYFIKNNLSIIISIAWQSWIIIGISNITAATYLYPVDNIEINNASIIYQLYFLFFILGIAFYENKNKNKNKINTIDSSTNNTSTWVILILIYPLLMFIQMYISIGYIPLLSGESIIDTMYNINYGFLYGYKAIIVISIIIAFDKFFISDKVSTKYAWGLLTLIYIFISLADGKRIMFLASSIVIFVYLMKEIGIKKLKIKLPLYITLLLTFYTGISLIRSSENAGDRGFEWANLFYSFGVEFKDYAWTVTYYNPGEIENYSWILSSIASFINGGFLKILGLNKGEMVSLDSARAWSDLFNIDLGIRTGIISEIWFSYGFLGLPILTLLGVFLSWITIKIYNEKNKELLYLYSYLYSFIFLMIMGQSSLFFGVSITAVYIYIARWLIYTFTRKI